MSQRWTRNLAALTEEGWIAETGQIDSSYIKARRSAGGAKKGGAGRGHVLPPQGLPAHRYPL